MIKNQTPVSMAEVEIILKETKTENKDLEVFLRKFVKIDVKDIEKIKQELRELNSIKIKEEHIAKIVDFLPEDVSDINKIFIDVSLDEDEKNKILEIVKSYL
ncbi:MAG: hypothetical protein AABY22_28920 [Nanoarchaeota archaeon]